MSAISHPACNVGRPFQQEQGEREERFGGFCVFTWLVDTVHIYQGESPSVSLHITFVLFLASLHFFSPSLISLTRISDDYLLGKGKHHNYSSVN